MSSIIEDLDFLKSSERFPKRTVTPLKYPRAQISSDEYNTLVDLMQKISMQFSHLSIEQYEYMRRQGQVINTLYTIYDDKGLYRVYLGKTLVMKRKTGEEQVTLGGVFPIVFPIIFP